MVRHTTTNTDLLELLLSIVNIAYSLAEVFILHSSADAEHDCGTAILSCIITCCVSHFITALLIYVYHTLKSDGHTPCYNRQQMHIFLILLSVPCFIWSCICLYGTDAACVRTFKDNYLHLWAMVITEVYTGISLITLCIVVKVYQKYINRRSNTELVVPIASSTQVNYVTV